MREKKTLSVYKDLKHAWRRESYAFYCSMKESSGTAWLRLGIYELKEWWRGRGSRRVSDAFCAREKTLSATENQAGHDTR
jgi:hypothetical protein